MDSKVIRLMTLKFTDLAGGEEDGNVLMADRNSSGGSVTSHANDAVSLDEEN